LMDKNGVIVSGKVDITYREFSDPVDFFLSGIPMNYDSGGTNYNFESAAMCEIYASQNGEPLFVNPLKKPEINLTTNNKDIEQNLYYLDTVSKQRIYKGKDLITDLKSEPVIKTVAPLKADEAVTPPTLPAKADKTKPSFTIIIEPGSV